MILDEIVRHKRSEVETAKRARPLEVVRREAIARSGRSGTFAAALRGREPVAVIAEIKRRSPSKGILRENFEPVAVARAYASAGAAALSVLTDERFFGGSPEHLRAVREAVRLPILRKDFILEAYQVYETRAMGADAMLLIASALNGPELGELSALGAELGLDCLVEVHSDADAEKALAVRPALVGINNRDLATFEVDRRTTERLAGRFLTAGITVISESGIQTHADLLYLKSLGVQAALVGESLVRQADVAAALRKLLGEGA